jgi:hypothetical protein
MGTSFYLPPRQVLQTQGGHYILKTISFKVKESYKRPYKYMLSLAASSTTWLLRILAGKIGKV